MRRQKNSLTTDPSHRDGLNIMERYAIFDLDNCLSDDSERIRLIDWEQKNPGDRYYSYHNACGHDKVGNLRVFTDYVLRLGLIPIFLTGRPNQVRDETIAWIADHLMLGTTYLLKMRKNGDHRSSVLVKQEMIMEIYLYPEYGITLSEIAIAFDDRLDIVQMYRKHGIPAAMLSIHNQDAYRQEITA
jgi:hypothetical protein